MIKKLAIAAVICGFGLSSMAQGKFNLSNGAAGVNAPINLWDGSLAPIGASYYVQAFGAAGTTTEAGSLQALGSAINFSLSPGYFFGGELVTSLAAGAATIQIRAWDASLGSTFPGLNVAGTGASGLVSINLVSGNNPPPNLVGLESFVISQVPEPATMALATIGGLGLLMLRRKNA